MMLALCARDVVAATDADVLLFPRSVGGFQAGGADPADRNDWFGEIGVDLFGTLNAGRVTGLAELLVTNEEQEFERLQVGWVMDQDTLWVGRFHNPLGFWNTQFHHGAFLQPTIQRPGLADFEDDGGVVPMHATGLLLQGSRRIGDRGLSYDLAVGLGPGYDPTQQSLEALNVLRPASGEQDHLVTARLTYYTEPGGNNQVGIFASATNIPVVDTVSDHLEQNVIGAFTAWEFSLVMVTADLEYVRTKLDLSTDPGTAYMVGGYVQVEYALSADWAVYGRAEDTQERSGTSYLALVPDFTQARVLGGLSYRFLGQNLLKLEISTQKTVQDRFDSITLEWSAAFP
jgi:hypothetical protein